jgi:hypothetical protein
LQKPKVKLNVSIIYFGIFGPLFVLVSHHFNEVSAIFFGEKKKRNQFATIESFMPESEMAVDETAPILSNQLPINDCSPIHYRYGSER